MKLDPTCPVELIGHDLLLDDRAHARAYLQMRCCSDSAPVRIEGCVRWIDRSSGNYTENIFEMDLDRAEPRAPFTVPVSASFVPQNVRLLVYFTRVLLSDGTQWTGGAETLRVYADQPVLPGHLANALSAEAGEDAVCCAQETGGGDWLCVCGRWNDRAQDECMRCGRDRAETLELFSPEAVETLSPGSGPLDIEPPLSDADDRAPHTVASPEKARTAPLRRAMVAVLWAVLFACLALGVRSARYARTHSAGLMPTSRSVETIDS